jgi:hypothetical protein
MSTRGWRIFALLNGIGAFLFTFGTIDGHAVTAAFLVVGAMLLLPGTFAAMPLLRASWLSGADDTLASLLAALVAVALNVAVWNIIVAVYRSRKKSIGDT